MNTHHIPAVIYHLIVRQWAESRNLPFWTVSQQRNARELYESFAKVNN